MRLTAATSVTCAAYLELMELKGIGSLPAFRNWEGEVCFETLYPTGKGADDVTCCRVVDTGEVCRQDWKLFQTWIPKLHHEHVKNSLRTGVDFVIILKVNVQKIARNPCEGVCCIHRVLGPLIWQINLCSVVFENVHQGRVLHWENIVNESENRV